MQFKYTTVLAGLLALSQTLWTTQAIPVTSLQPVENSVSVRDDGISPVDNVHVYYTKRAPEDQDWSSIMFQGENNLLKTWSGWIDEPPSSGWDERTINRLAEAAHAHISRQRNEPWILVALWIRGEGVAFGSQVRGNSFADRSADRTFEHLLRSYAPVLWEHVQYRESFGGNNYPKWHAEDVAMWKAAKEMMRKGKPIGGTRYPANSMSIFGRYTLAHQASKVPPCKSLTLENNSNLLPGCEEVLRDVGISVYIYL